jgi:GT2 family glycosyltransferase
MLRNHIDIICPTWNNYEQLTSFIGSVLRYNSIYPVRFIVVNNGEKEMSEQPFFQHSNITMLTPGENLGWEGGLKLGLEHSTSEFVMLANDDLYVPECSKHWLLELLQPFHDKNVGAVGPSSNVVMGQQNIFTERRLQSDGGFYEVPFLIGYCVLVRREALDKAGGIDDTLPGGDDLDLSIRIQDAGYSLVMSAKTFVYHHGFQTGTRVHGDHTKPNGWNSTEMTENTNMALIRKHGLKRWYQCLYSQPEPNDGFIEDAEGDLIREKVKEGTTLELGCGATKTVPDATGVDLIPKGEPISSIRGVLSVADIVADVTSDIPLDGKTYDNLIARHILEHCQDTLDTLDRWYHYLKPGGKLIIAVPNQEEGETIPMNPEHLHSFTPKSLQHLVEAVTFENVEVYTNINGVSMVLTAEKPL